MLTNLFSNQRSVFIQNIQTINAAGSSREQVQENLWRPRSCLDVVGEEIWAGRLSEETADQLVELGGEAHLKDYDPAALLGVMVGRRLAERAWNSDAAVVFGSSRGATRRWERDYATYLQSGKCPATTSPTTTMGCFTASICRDLQLQGMQCAVSAACATSMQAVLMGASLLQAGMAPEVLAGGAEHSCTSFTFTMLQRARVYHRKLTTKYVALHPQRSGMVLGEGAAAARLSLAFEGALGQILAVASRSEQSTLTGLKSDGSGVAELVRQLLARGGLGTSDVGAVVIHGSGTKQGDAAELAGLSKVFGIALPPLTNDKWCYGHTLGAAGTSALAFALEVSRRGRTPDLPIDEPNLVPELQAREFVPGKPVLVLSLGFGGILSGALVRSL